MQSFTAIILKSGNELQRELVTFKRVSNYKALTGKYLVFWISGRLQEVVLNVYYYIYISKWNYYPYLAFLKRLGKN